MCTMLTEAWVPGHRAQVDLLVRWIDGAIAGSVNLRDRGAIGSPAARWNYAETLRPASRLGEPIPVWAALDRLYNAKATNTQVQAIAPLVAPFVAQARREAQQED